MSLFSFIQSSISFFIKNILLGDIFIFLGKSPFVTRRLIVDTEIPSNVDTSLIVKNGRFSWLIMVGIWWEYSWNSCFFHINLRQALSGKVFPTFARGVYKFQKVIQSHTKKVTFFYFFDLFFLIVVSLKSSIFDLILRTVYRTTKKVDTSKSSKYKI